MKNSSHILMHLTLTINMFSYLSKQNTSSWFTIWLKFCTNEKIRIAYDVPKSFN